MYTKTGRCRYWMEVIAYDPLELPRKKHFHTETFSQQKLDPASTLVQHSTDRSGLHTIRAFRHRRGLAIRYIGNGVQNRHGVCGGGEGEEEEGEDGSEDCAVDGQHFGVEVWCGRMGRGMEGWVDEQATLEWVHPGSITSYRIAPPAAASILIRNTDSLVHNDSMRLKNRGALASNE